MLWDEDGTVVKPDGTPGPGGLALAPVLAGLRGPLATTLLAAQPRSSPIGVLYSQASFRMRWLLDRRAERKAGQDWTARDNDTDLADSPWRTALTGTAAALDHLGLHPDYLDEANLAPARLAGLQAILLPASIVLDEPAVTALRAFAARGGTILADIEPGAYDDFGTRRAAPPLAGLGQRLGTFDTAGLRQALHAPATVTTPDGTPRDDVSVFWFDGGSMAAIQPDQANGAGPAVAAIGRWRCTIDLDSTVPSVLTVESSGVSAVAVDGTRLPVSCTRP